MKRGRTDAVQGVSVDDEPKITKRVPATATRTDAVMKRGVDHDSVTASAAAAKVGDAPADSPIRILVIGRTADGKSTIMREVARDGEEIPVKVWSTRNPDGTITKGTGPNVTTKGLSEYAGKDMINGRSVKWIDTPGIRDGDVGLVELQALLQEQFDSQSIDLLVVTHNLTEVNLGLERQIAMQMMNRGLTKEAWKNVIITGTHRDIARDENIREFEDSVLKTIFDAAGVEPQFCYTGAVEMGKNPATCENNMDVRRLDVSELLVKIGQMCKREDHAPMPAGKAFQLTREEFRSIIHELTGVDSAT